MNRFIEGETIYLRAIEATDAGDRYLSWMNDEEVTKGLASGVFPTTLDDLKKYIQNITSTRNAVMFAVCDKQNDLHVGNIKLDNFDWVNRTCELGLLLGDQSYWGKGVGTQVMELTLQYAFHQLNIRKVVLAVYANNPGAIRLYEKVGFQKEGCLRDQIFYKGEYIDKYYMSIFSNQHS
jgi:ribosomal-protein-alanine N-acetyltransferase